MFTICFSLRAGTFIYRFVTQQEDEPAWLIISSIYIPELVPTMLQLFLLEYSKGKEQKTTQFFDDLYAGSSDALINDVIVPTYSSADYKTAGIGGFRPQKPR